jgi:hypothetical protein
MGAGAEEAGAAIVVTNALSGLSLSVNLTLGGGSPSESESELAAAALPLRKRFRFLPHSSSGSLCFLLSRAVE